MSKKFLHPGEEPREACTNIIDKEVDVPLRNAQDKQTTEQQQPLVSIIIPAYNCSKVITKTLVSVYEQTYQNWEIIIIDDGSTDDTKSALETHMDRIRYFYQENKGTAAARNAGVRRANGGLIAFLDNDDLWLPDKIALQVQAMQENPNIGLVFTDGKLFDENGILKNSLINERIQSWIDQNKDEDPHVVKGWIARELFFGNIIASATSVLLRKESIESVGGFDEQISIADDYDIWLRIAQHYPVVLIYLPLYMWRYREDSASGPKENRGYVWKKAALPVLEKNLFIAPKEMRKEVRLSLSRKYWECGWVDFSQNRLPESRKMFLRSLHHNKLSIYAAGYLLLTFLNPYIINKLRYFKQRIRKE